MSPHQIQDLLSIDHVAVPKSWVRTINARCGEAVKAWEERIVLYVGRRDDQTIDLAKHLDTLQRRGVDVVRVLAVSRKPLPVDRPTAALAYRLRGIAGAKQRQPARATNPLDRRPPQPSGPAMGM